MDRARLRIVLPALGIAQIISWGSLFYAIAVLAQPMGAELHLTRVQIFAGFSLALAISGLLSPRVGRLIDARDGRFVLCRGIMVGGAALVILASAQHYATLLLGWCAAGVAMSMTLYDPAFATLGQLAAERYRRALTGLTLIAGFASTVFWPLTHALVQTAGWRSTLLIFAGLHIAVALPVIAAFVPRPARSAKPVAAPTATQTAPGRPTPAQLWLASCFALAAFVFSSMSAHLVGVLELKGLTTSQAVGLLSLVGPMQVTGRVLEMSFGARFSVARVGVFAFALLASALVLLLFVHGPGAIAFLFVIGYGCANGIVTIVRGVLPAALFGHDSLGRLLGWLARPSFVAQAIAPAAVAGLLMSGSPQLVVAVAAGTIVVALGCLVLAVRSSWRADS
jgi:predicted MFS family arabinose efflux permease